MYQNKCLKYMKETSQLYQVNDYYILNRCGPNRCLRCIKEMSQLYIEISNISLMYQETSQLYQINAPHIHQIDVPNVSTVPNYA